MQTSPIDWGETRVLNFIYALGVGGTERQFLYITRALHERGLSMRTAVMLWKGSFLKDVQEIGVPMGDYSISSMYSYRSLRQQWRLRRDVRRQGIDIVHAYGFYANVFAVPPSRLAFRPAIVASVRDTGVYLTPMMRRAQLVACRMADCVLANSNAVKNWLVNDGLNPARIRVIHNGIVIPDLDRPRESLRQQIGIPTDSPVIATVCRVNRSKGLEHFLQAAVQVLRRTPKARFLIVGTDGNEPGYKAELEQFARQAGLESNVIFLGQRRDVTEILKDVDIFVLPSLSESLSNALLEAMAVGLPCVATDVGGNPELVRHGETGFLVPARNSDELATAICRLIDNPELAREFGAVARRRVMNEFSIENLANQTQALYAELLRRRTHRLSAFRVRVISY